MSRLLHFCFSSISSHLEYGKLENELKDIPENKKVEHLMDKVVQNAIDHNYTLERKRECAINTDEKKIGQPAIDAEKKAVWSDKMADFELNFGKRRRMIGDKYKHYEKEQRYLVKPEFLIVRCDMRCGTKETKHLKKPFDENFTNAMKLTQEKLHFLYKPDISYKQSDEISMVFIKKTDIWNLRLQKIVSVIAAETAVYFNSFINEMLENRTIAAVFDCRAFNVNSREECFEYLYWRNYYDCQCNSLNAIARQFYSQKELDKKNVREVFEMLAAKNVSVQEEYSIANLCGTFSKREKIEKSGYNPIKNKTVIAERNVVKSESFLMNYDYSNDFFKSI